MRDILLTRRALKDLDTIEEGLKERILTKLREYEEYPLRYARKLTNPKIGTYRFHKVRCLFAFDL